ncbi:MAG: S41 family peptidase [Pyrinomonadaceae bacterium]
MPPLPYFAEPAISPDRAEIAFVSGGDIWSVAAAGGDAHLLVSHPANESRPLFSPDGRKLAFISTRTGNGDIYVLTLDSGDLQRITFDDAFDQLDAWSRDGRWLYFSSTSRDIASMNDIFRVSTEGGTPLQVSADRYVNEFFSAPSPDGNTLAFTARGLASAQWWRKGHSHIDESEIWLMRNANDGGGNAAANYERITEGGAKQMWPMWSADGRKLFYVSDRSGAQNIWTKTIGGEAKQVTRFTDGRVLWPNISYDGRTIVFEHDFSIWTLDASNGKASELRINRRGAPSSPGTEHLTITNGIQELALSPDGKKNAFVVRGEIFAASAKDGGDAARITTSPANESEPAWSPDSRRLAYVSDRDGATHLFVYDFATNTETQLTRDAAANDNTPCFSPDGKRIAFERNGRELRAIDLNSKQERLLATGYLERPPFNSDRPFVWSTDGRWIAFMAISGKSFKNIYVVSSTGGANEARPVSFLANVGSNSVAWSPDGAFLLFDTGQRTETGQLARVDLVPRTPRFREDQFRDLFKEETPKTVTPTLQRQENQPQSPVPQRDAPNTTPSATPSPAASPTASPATESDETKKPVSKPTEIVFDGIRQRLSLLPVGVDVSYQIISPDGKVVLMIAGSAGQQNLYTYSLDELAKEPAIARQLTSTPGQKSFAQFTSDSKEIFYLEDGRINVVSLDTRTPRAVVVSAEMDVDFAREKQEVFQQAWTYLRDNFFDANFNGVDWQATYATYAPRISGARTPDELRRLLQLMVGELNASHLGVSAPPGGTQPSTGRIGLRFDRTEYETNGRLRVTEILPLSAAALAGNIKPGDYLLAVDGKQTGARVNLDELLNYKINRRVALAVASSADGANKREVVVRPVNAATEKGLLYRTWVEDNRAYVARVSGGRFGYVHMYDMSSASLAQLFVDLDAENNARDGVIVDIRNNNGGFVNAYALDVFERRPYLTLTPRGLPPATARTVLGQRALEAPTILVTNQHSLSDAEDFSEGYRALRLGKIVGEPTAGWIIYTSNQRLVDGSSFRIPFMRVTASDGSQMELHPRPVDVNIVRPIGEGFGGRDTQLDAATRELLNQLGARRNVSTTRNR